MTKKAAPAPTDPGDAQSAQDAPQYAVIYYDWAAIPSEKREIYQNAVRTGRELTADEIKHIFGLDAAAAQKVKIIDKNAMTAPPSLLVPLRPEAGFYRENMILYHGKGTDELAKITPQSAQATPRGGAVMQSHGLTVTYRNVLSMQPTERGRGLISIQDHKLLTTAISFFTEKNGHPGPPPTIEDCKISFPLADYAEACGYNVTPRTADESGAPLNADALEREKKRAAGAIKDARIKIKRSIETLDQITLRWEERPRSGGKQDFEIAHLIAGGGVKNGVVSLTLSPDLAKYLMTQPKTQLPTALLSIDARNENAYRIGYDMARHYNNDNNQTRGTAARLKVETVLASTDLPTIEEVRKRRGSWEERIKEPLERALDVLTARGVLEDWSYTRAKGAPLTDSEAAALANDYDSFIETYITYSLANPPDHTPRLAKKAAAIEAAAPKKTGRKARAK